MLLKNGVTNVGWGRCSGRELSCADLRWNEVGMDNLVYGGWDRLDSSASDVARGLSGQTVMLASNISLESSKVSVWEFLESGASERVPSWSGKRHRERESLDVSFIRLHLVFLCCGVRVFRCVCRARWTSVVMRDLSVVVVSRTTSEMVVWSCVSSFFMELRKCWKSS